MAEPKVILSWNIANWITVVLMVTVVWVVVGYATSRFAAMRAPAAATA